MATVTQSSIGNLHEKLTVTLAKADYAKSFETQLKNYSKKANLPGFRVGMVPVSLIRKQYGTSVLYDVVFKKIDDELNKYFSENNTKEIFGQPLPMNTDIKLDAFNLTDISLDFEIGVKPKLQVEQIENLTLDYYKAEASEKLIEEEITSMRKKAGKLEDIDEVNDEENVLNILFEETDADGTIIENGIKKENTLVLKYFTPAVQHLLKGKKVDDHIQFQLAQSFDGKELEYIVNDLGLGAVDDKDAQKFFKYTIKKISKIKDAELNEEFFKTAYPNDEIKTEEEFKSKVAADINVYLANQSKNKFHDSIYQKYMDTCSVELPEEFLKKWLASNDTKKSPDDIEREFPAFVKQMKWLLISQELVKQNNITAGIDELKDFMRKEVMGYFGGYGMADNMDWIDGYVDRMLKDPKTAENNYQRLLTQKLFDTLEEKAIKNEKVVTSEELIDMLKNTDK